MDNSNSMVMYNATVRGGMPVKTEASGIMPQTDQTNLMSQGNQILFDSKAFDRMPSSSGQAPPN